MTLPAHCAGRRSRSREQGLKPAPDMARRGAAHQIMLTQMRPSRRTVLACG